MTEHKSKQHLFPGPKPGQRPSPNFGNLGTWKSRYLVGTQLVHQGIDHKTKQLFTKIGQVSPKMLLQNLSRPKTSYSKTCPGLMMLFQNSTGPKKVIPKLISPKRCYPKTRQGREISFQNWSGPKDIIPKLISPRRCYPKTCQGRQMLSQNLSGPKDCIPKMVSPKRCYPKTCQGRDMLFQNWSGLGAGRWGGNKNV